MLDKRIQAINGKGKMTLADMAKRGPHQNNDVAYGVMRDTIVDLVSEKVRKETRAEMKEEMDGLEEKLKLANESKETEAELFGQIKEQLESQNTELRTAIETMKADIKTMKEAEIGKDLDHDMSLGIQKGLLRDVEIKLADALGRLDQAHKQIYELKESAKQIPMPLVVEKPIPSFSFKPVKDGAGNIVEVIATPVGG